MSRYEDLKIAQGIVEQLAKSGKWVEHAEKCQTLKAIQFRPWCRGCGEYQRECSCDDRQEVLR